MEGQLGANERLERCNAVRRSRGSQVLDLAQPSSGYRFEPPLTSYPEGTENHEGIGFSPHKIRDLERDFP